MTPISYAMPCAASCILSDQSPHMFALPSLELAELSQLSRAKMERRYTTRHIQPSHVLTDTTDSLQFHVAMREPRLQTLNACINASRVGIPVHPRRMDEQTLDRFGVLGLETCQRQPEEEAKGNGRREKGRGMDEEVNQTRSLPLEATSSQIFLQTSRQKNPNHTISSQPLPIKTLGPVQKARSQDKDGITRDMIPHKLWYQSSQSFVTPSQGSNILHHQSSQGFNLSSGVSVQPQHTRLRPKAPPFIPQRLPSKSEQLDIKSLAHDQKTSLSVFHYRGHFPHRVNKAYRFTKAAPADSILPVRPKCWASLPLPSTQAFSPSSTNSQDRDWKDKKWHNKQSVAQKQDLIQKRNNSDELIHLPAPEPTKAYLANANAVATHLNLPQSLLLILDLNGTLLYRTTKATSYVPRTGLEKFLDYCFADHSVLIWSSARPHNVAGVCEKLFTPVQRELLLGQWGRDTLGLTSKQYHQRVQVYKCLEIVWNNAAIQSRHPDFPKGGRWGQHNTVLIDDSAMKAAAQPFNHIEVPEFVSAKNPAEARREVLKQVILKLEEMRFWNDVSALMRAQRAGKGCGNEQDTLPLDMTGSLLQSGTTA